MAGMANEENKIQKSRFCDTSESPLWPDVTCDASGLGTVHHIGTACPLKFTAGTALHVSQTWPEVTCDTCWNELFAPVLASLAEKRVAQLDAMRAEVRTARKYAATEMTEWSAVLGDALDLEARLSALIRRSRAENAPEVSEVGQDTSEPQNRSQPVATPVTSKPMPY